MEIYYQLFREESLFAQRFSGEFVIPMYRSYMARVHSQIAVKAVKRVLIDFRDMVLTQDEVFRIKSKVEKMIRIRKKIDRENLSNQKVVLVFWVATPLQTVVARLFSNGFPSRKYDYCSTEQAVLGFLGISSDFDLSGKMEALKNVFVESDSISGCCEFDEKLINRD